MSNLNEIFKDARINFRNGEYQKAIENYQIVLKHKPDLIEGWNNIGLCYAKSGKMDEAIKSFDAIANLNPKLYFLWRNLGIIYQQLKDYHKVIETYQKGLHFFPDNAVFWYSLGVVYNLLNDFENAIKSYIKALECDPKHEAAWKNLCIMYSKKGAMIDLEGYKANTEIAWHLLAKQLSKYGLYRDSLDAINRCLELNPTYSAAYILRKSIKFAIEKREQIQHSEKLKNQQSAEDPYLKRFKRIQEKRKKEQSTVQNDTDPLYSKFKEIQERFKKRQIEITEELNSAKHEELDFDESTKPIKKEIEKSEEKEQLRIDKPIGRPLKDGFIKINGKSFQKQNLWFVIDGANVALTQKTSHLQGKLSKLELIKERLINMDILNYKIICDCSLKHKIDEPAIYSKLVNSGDIIETPAGTQADNFILQYAKNKGAFIISNDRFKEYYNNFGKDWIKEKRIMFTFIEDTVYFDKIFGL